MHSSHAPSRPRLRPRLRRLALPAALGAGCLVAGPAAAAVVPVGQIPATSATAAGFAPAGWVVEKTVAGDLNGDGVKDLAIVLIQSPSGGGAYNVVDGSRALVLATGGGGTFTRRGVAPRLLGCNQCGGAFWGTAPMPVGVKLVTGTLVVRQQFGARMLTTTTHRIRWGAAVRRFRLVGLDTLVVDRATGASTAVSTNHLTRRQVTTRKQGTRVVSRVQRTVPVTPRPLAGLRFGRLTP